MYDFEGASLTVSDMQVLIYPGYEVIFKCPFDELME